MPRIQAQWPEMAINFSSLVLSGKWLIFTCPKWKSTCPNFHLPEFTVFTLEENRNFTWPVGHAGWEESLIWQLLLLVLRSRTILNVLPWCGICLTILVLEVIINLKKPTLPDIVFPDVETTRLERIFFQHSMKTHCGIFQQIAWEQEMERKTYKIIHECVNNLPENWTQKYYKVHKYQYCK